jgi:hypothetical protein
MNIYCASWVQGGCFGLSAVVVAPDESTALRELNLADDDTKITVYLLGTEKEPSTAAWVVAQESL